MFSISFDDSEMFLEFLKNNRYATNSYLQLRKRFNFLFENHIS